VSPRDTILNCFVPIRLIPRERAISRRGLSPYRFSVAISRRAKADTLAVISGTRQQCNLRTRGGRDRWKTAAAADVIAPLRRIADKGAKPSARLAGAPTAGAWWGCTEAQKRRG